MIPTEILKSDHRVIERVLVVLDRASAKLEHGEAVDPSIFTDSVDFIRNFADRCHHIKEEDNLFRLMGERGFPISDGPVAVMLAEHEEGRAFVRALAEAAERYAKGDREAAGEIIRNGRGFAMLLSQHIMKEDNILYPMANNVFSPADQRDLEALFERLEVEVIGEGGHQKYIEMVDRLEKAVGIASQSANHAH